MRPETLEYLSKVREVMAEVPDTCVLAGCRCGYYIAMKWQLGDQFCDRCATYWYEVNETWIMMGVMNSEEFAEWVKGEVGEDAPEPSDQSDHEEASGEPVRRKRRTRYNPGDDPDQSGFWGAGDDS